MDLYLVTPDSEELHPLKSYRHRRQQGREQTTMQLLHSPMKVIRQNAGRPRTSIKVSVAHCLYFDFLLRCDLHFGPGFVPFPVILGTLSGQFHITDELHCCSVINMQDST